MNILIVDENSEALSQLEEYVRAGYPYNEVIRFSNPRQAADYSKSHLIDMVFTEINMKLMDGFSLVQKLRDVNPSIRVNFVAQTGQYAVEAFRLHADGYFLKPLTSEMPGG